jgi:hypothetical protein
MTLGGTNLFFYKIKVVEQPFPGRRDSTVCFDSLGQQVSDAEQDVCIFGQPPQEAVPRASRPQPVQGREGLPMLLHLSGAEQLRSERRLVGCELPCRAVSAKARFQTEQGLAHGRARFHLLQPLDLLNHIFSS